MSCVMSRSSVCGGGQFSGDTGREVARRRFAAQGRRVHHDAELLAYLREHAHERQGRRTVIEQVVVGPEARPTEYLTDDAENDVLGRVRRDVLLHGNSRSAGHEGTTYRPRIRLRR